MKNITFILSLLLVGCVLNSRQESSRQDAEVYIGCTDRSRDGLYIALGGGHGSTPGSSKIVFTNFDGNLSFSISFYNLFPDDVMVFTGEDVMFLSPPDVDCYGIDGKLIETLTIGPTVSRFGTSDWDVLFLGRRLPDGKERCLYWQIGTIHYSRQVIFASPKVADIEDHSPAGDEQPKDVNSRAGQYVLSEKTWKMEFRIPMHVGFYRLHSDKTYTGHGTNVTLNVRAYRYQPLGQPTNALYSQPASPVETQ